MMNKLLVLMSLMIFITGCTPCYFAPAFITYTDNSNPEVNATYTSTTY